MITPQSRAADFPSLRGQTYLNTAAESIPPLCVRDALQAYFEDKGFGMHGRQMHYEHLEQCRRIAGRMIRLAPDEISFCSCSAEAYNLLSSALNLERDDEVIVNDLDFPSGATPWLVSRPKPGVRLWKSREGGLDLADLVPLLTRRTRLVQVSLVSFYNGYRLPWTPFANVVRRKSPQALISVDVTQALGRCVFDCHDADFIVSSTHKWTLGIHGGCIVGVPKTRSKQLTARAGGWHHLTNAFDADRFERVMPKEGAPSYSVGMPSFAPIYALNASLRYLDAIGVKTIARHADPLVETTRRGLEKLGLTPMAPVHAGLFSGIVAFLHPMSAEIHECLERQTIHVMHHVGRLRISLHGYNTREDVARLLDALGEALARRTVSAGASRLPTSSRPPQAHPRRLK
ncbi:MAG: aminotransferase class V-fold PLP-dependent enzyme [Verrucomicrobia bacterium]|nr:aminotransferase class V-fold PLP-dependent enzyme [Verrucomicrobiota bacterium]